MAHQGMCLITYLDSLCARVLKSKYFPHGNLLDMAPAGEASPMWRAIEHGVELLKHGVIKRIGDGESTHIWRDNWILRQPNLKPSDATHMCRLRRVSQLMKTGHNEWDMRILCQFFYPWDVDDILKIKLPMLKTSDWVAWNYENIGGFSVCSAYHLALMRATNMDEVGTSSERGGEQKCGQRSGSCQYFQRCTTSLQSLFAPMRRL
jgi:hypothetical protein